MAKRGRAKHGVKQNRGKTMTEKTFSNCMGGEDWHEYFTDDSRAPIEATDAAWHETHTRMVKALQMYLTDLIGVPFEIETGSQLDDFMAAALIEVMHFTASNIGEKVLGDDYDIDDLVPELAKRVKICDEILNIEQVTEEELAIWSGFFSTLVGWAEHPGYYRENATKPTLEKCAATADEMLQIRRRRHAD